MNKEEAIKKIESYKAIMCFDCMHPQMVGWCEKKCCLPEALELAIEALKETKDNK